MSDLNLIATKCQRTSTFPLYVDRSKKKREIHNLFFLLFDLHFEFVRNQVIDNVSAIDGIWSWTTAINHSFHSQKTWNPFVEWCHWSWTVISDYTHDLFEETVYISFVPINQYVGLRMPIHGYVWRLCHNTMVSVLQNNFSLFFFFCASVCVSREQNA